MAVTTVQIAARTVFVILSIPNILSMGCHYVMFQLIQLFR